MIYYCDMLLDRAGELRKKKGWLKKQWAHKHCRVLVVNENKSLMQPSETSSNTPEAAYILRHQNSALDAEIEDLIFLGLNQDGPLFALDVSNFQVDQQLAVAGKHEFIDMRDFSWLLEAQQAAHLAYARGLAFWNRHQLYCGLCGSLSRSENGGHMRRCSNLDCGRQHFPRTDPAVIMLVEDRSEPDNPRCLLARNVRFPSRMMSTLAGFVDPMESLEETVVREVFEECGIRVGRVDYKASQPWPFPSSIMLGFRAQAVSTKIKIDNHEIEEAHWFDLEQLKAFGEWGDQNGEFCLPRHDSIARYLIETWLHEQTSPIASRI